MLLRCILAHLLVLHCRAFLISVGLLVLRSLFLLCQEIIVDGMFAIENDAHFFESDLGGYSIVSRQTQWIDMSRWNVLSGYVKYTSTISNRIMQHMTI
jgi:hypothetical protein